MTDITIRPGVQSDANVIATIYNHYVLNTVVSFEEQAVSTDDMAARMREILEAGLPWLVAEADRAIVGFCYASKWKGRCAYRNSLETTIYVASDHVGKGAGSKLYTSLLATIRESRYHTVIGGIALPNPASVALHEKLGYRKVAHFEQVGFKHGSWVDVAYWQLML